MQNKSFLIYFKSFLLRFACIVKLQSLCLLQVQTRNKTIMRTEQQKKIELELLQGMSKEEIINITLDLTDQLDEAERSLAEEVSKMALVRSLVSEEG